VIKIIGLDPGINKTGWAIISLNEKNNIEFLGGGIISTGSKFDTGERSMTST
jgi:crossover junction endodeoxyribonuclease RuvC